MSAIWNRLLTCLRLRKPVVKETRTVYVGNHIPPTTEVLVHETFRDNRVTSSKYTVINFLPKNLFEQFQRIANFYFLCVLIIQFTIDTPTSFTTSLVPLVFVITVAAVKQGYEDRLRHKSDNEVNNRMVSVIRDGALTEIKSMEIQVGDIVRVDINRSFPCDMVMLSSHDPQGTCSVQTANLDGETSLKTVSCVPETKTLQKVPDLDTIQAYIICEEPTTNLYKFAGNIVLMTSSDDVTHEAIRPINEKNVLLRGARLKNTHFVYGCAIYTGQESKMALNSKFKTTKFSRVEKRMNIFLIVFLIVLLIEACICTGLKYWYTARPKDGQPPYVPTDSRAQVVDAKGVIEDFVSFVVLFNYIIPISLYVTIEFQKFFGSLFFGWDVEMYDFQTNQPAKANTSDLNEELGQIEYLFTDKTGTLTENDMQFRQCSIRGQKYIEVGGMLCEKAASVEEQPQPVIKLTAEIEEFLTVLVACHDVRVDHIEGVHTTGAASIYSADGFGYEYQASSPDEKAFVEACRRYHVVYHGISDGHLEVTFSGKMKRYRLLHLLDFDPFRKRMSVIVQNEQGEILLLCKGAEQQIVERTTKGDTLTTRQHMNEFAMLGLRTLAVGQRKMTAEEYTHCDNALKNANVALKNRDEQLSDVYNYIENDLELLGCTAVEDRLQEGVPETIEAIRQAGIKVWVLTGDKVETAVNVSYSAGHFKEHMVELKLVQLISVSECREMMMKHQVFIQKYRVRADDRFVLIVDGQTLNFILRGLCGIFVDLCHLCVAVLCCQMTPLQKAEIVRMIKMGKNSPITAAIGDGANDVSMIQEAHLGMGIMGREGRQAVRSSDYAFARFRFLKRALLVHGHYYYLRIATLVQYFFYKNVAFCTAQVFFTFFSAFSQQTIYDTLYLMFYNLAFTALPILIYGLFEKHVDDKTLMDKPQLYKTIAKNKELSAANFIKWNLLGIWHSTVFFFGSYLMLAQTGEEMPISASGQMSGMGSFGSIILLVCVITVNIKLGLVTYYWCTPVFISFFLTFAVFIFTVILFYNSFIWPLVLDIQSLFGVVTHILSSGTVWLGLLLLITLALIPDIIIRVITDMRSHPLYRINQVGVLSPPLDTSSPPPGIVPPPLIHKSDILGNGLTPKPHPAVF